MKLAALVALGMFALGCASDERTVPSPEEVIQTVLDGIPQDEHAPTDLWDAYDEGARNWLARNPDVSIDETRRWLSTLPGYADAGLMSIAPGSLAVFPIGNSRLVFAWSEPVYLSGGRVSLFVREEHGWVRRDMLDLAEASSVIALWSADAALVVSEYVIGNDGAHTLHGIRADEDGLVREFITEPFLDMTLTVGGDGFAVQHGRDSGWFTSARFTRLRRELRVSFDGQRFAMTVRSLSPALDSLEMYCLTRGIAKDAAAPFVDSSQAGLLDRLPTCEPALNLQGITEVAPGVFEAQVLAPYLCEPPPSLGYDGPDDDGMLGRTDEIIIRIEPGADGLFRLAGIRAVDTSCEPKRALEARAR